MSAILALPSSFEIPNSSTKVSRLVLTPKGRTVRIILERPQGMPLAGLFGRVRPMSREVRHA